MIQIISALLLSLLLLGCSKQNADVDGYVGSKTCSSCHVQEYRNWQKSHHDLAMKEATADSVLGNFADARFSKGKIVSRFFSKANAGQTSYWVETDNHSGEMEAFQIKYTFGVTPLQQYLIELPDGRVQALSIAWDSRTKEQGGQKWFHLYPNETSDSDSPFHWTSFYNNWNNRCADCHSTNFKKGFDEKLNRYESTWSEINVACEACHGPGEAHTDWAIEKDSDDKTKGLKRSIDAASIESILLNADSNSIDDIGDSQLAICGSCHSRRSLIANPTVSDKFENIHRLDLLTEPNYHPDGQIKEEVYVLGSFLQSKMVRKGVVCSHCHEPHTLKLRAPGNQLCLQCHEAQSFDTGTHHQHPVDSLGSQCVNCHMPATTYMVVDPRRDHSFRIPSPELSKQHNIPNACNQCHTEESVDWAIDAINHWRSLNPNKPKLTAALVGQGPIDQQEFDRLSSLAASDQPALIRASALERLRSSNSPSRLTIASQHLNEESLLARTSAIRLTEGYPLAQKLELLTQSFNDPNRAIRFAAVETVLSPGLAAAILGLNTKDQDELSAALKEYFALLLEHQDSSHGLTNIALYHYAMGDLVQAESTYRLAISTAPTTLAPIVNLADLYRQQNKNQAAVAVLSDGITHFGKEAALNHALGLALVRIKQYGRALPHLKVARDQNPDSARYSYVYAVALNNQKEFLLAIEESKRALAIHGEDTQLLSLALDSAIKLGDLELAHNFASKLKRLQNQN